MFAKFASFSVLFGLIAIGDSTEGTQGVYLILAGLVGASLIAIVKFNADRLAKSYAKQHKVINKKIHPAKIEKKARIAGYNVRIVAKRETSPEPKKAEKPTEDSPKVYRPNPDILKNINSWL